MMHPFAPGAELCIIDIDAVFAAEVGVEQEIHTVGTVFSEDFFFYCFVSHSVTPVWQRKGGCKPDCIH